VRSFRPISLPYGLERLEGNGSGREAKASATGDGPGGCALGAGAGAGAQPTRAKSRQASRNWRASFPLGARPPRLHPLRPLSFRHPLLEAAPAAGGPQPLKDLASFARAARAALRRGRGEGALLMFSGGSNEVMTTDSMLSRDAVDEASCDHVESCKRACIH